MAVSDLLPVSAVRLDVRAADWREAIRQVGGALVDSGATEPAYTDEMIDVVERMGPYIVIAPGIALGHARPSPAVISLGLAWVRLAEPVPFGHPDNDPVSLVVGLAAPDSDAHTGTLATFARLLSDEHRRARLRQAPDAETLLHEIDAYEQES